MSDMTTPTYSPRVSRLRGAYERQSEAGNLAGAFGDTARSDRYSGRAAQTLARLTAAGGDASGIDIADFSGQFDPTSARSAINTLSRGAAQRADARGGNYDRTRNRSAVRMNNDVSGLLQSRETAQKQNEWDTNILPTYTGAMDRLNQLAGTNAISAEQEGQLRSQIAATNRTTAASNLGRVSSALGMRGMSDSPAAAALASSVAQDYDVSLSNSLADMGLQVSQMNREQTRQDSAAAASMATLRANSENAYMSNDINAQIQIGRDTAALIDAMYSRDKTFDLMQKQVDEAGKESTLGRLNGWVGLGQGVVGLASSIAGMPGMSGGSGGSVGGASTIGNTPMGGASSLWA